MSSETIKQWKAPEEDIVRYKINVTVSSKYLDLTKRKLELTRLPREVPLPATEEWKLGTPTASLEPLLDTWLDGYSWRDQEAHINETLPQFRTTLAIPAGTEKKEKLFRTHFVHKRSIANDAIPLLYIHGYPGSFLEVGKIVGPLSSTIPTHLHEQSASFHVVAPSVPGFGFSDAIMHEGFGARETAKVFDALMRKLGYTQYVVACSPQGWKITRWLLSGSGCVAVHMCYDASFLRTFSPRIQPSAPFEMKTWSSFFRRSAPELVPVLKEYSNPRPEQQITACPEPTQVPQTLAYGLADSPVGLLASILQQISNMGNLHIWSQTDVLNWAMLQWLPGPEAGLRWAWATKHEQYETSESNVHVGITAYRELQDGGAPSNTKDVSKLNAIMEENQIVPVIWSRNRTGKAGIPALDAASDVIVDLRDFCAVGQREGWLQDFSPPDEAPTSLLDPAASTPRESSCPVLSRGSRTQVEDDETPITTGDDEEQKGMEESLGIEESVAVSNQSYRSMLWRWLSFRLT